jgi:hypothetical protein
MEDQLGKLYWYKFVGCPEALEREKRFPWAMKHVCPSCLRVELRVIQ